MLCIQLRGGQSSNGISCDWDNPMSEEEITANFDTETNPEPVVETTQ